MYVQIAFHFAEWLKLLNPMSRSNCVFQVPKSDFHVLLRYLENLKGKAREITVKQAEGLIEKLEDKIQDLDKEGKSSDGEEEEDAEEVKKMKVQWRRATDILQTLS